MMIVITSEAIFSQGNPADVCTVLRHLCTLCDISQTSEENLWWLKNKKNFDEVMEFTPESTRDKQINT